MRIISALKSILKGMDRWDTLVDLVAQLGEVIRLQTDARRSAEAGAPNRAEPPVASDLRVLVPIVAVAWLAIAGGARCQDPTTRESLEFSQRKVRANMQELEERMFRLSTLLRDAQPESAARLVLGLKRSREELIVADMDEARAFIAAGKLEEAAERQRVIIVSSKSCGACCSRPIWT